MANNKVKSLSKMVVDRRKSLIEVFSNYYSFVHDSDYDVSSEEDFDELEEMIDEQLEKFVHELRSFK